MIALDAFTSPGNKQKRFTKYLFEFETHQSWRTASVWIIFDEIQGKMIGREDKKMHAPTRMAVKKF